MRFAACLVASSLLVACADGESSSEGGGRFDEARTDEIKKDAPAPDVAAAPTTDAPDTAASAPAEDKPPTPKVNTCREARDLGELNADAYANTSTLQARGTCSEWLKIRGVESNLDSVSMQMKLTLVSPTDADYDMHVYLNEKEDALECSTAVAKSEVPASRSDVVSIRWGDMGWWWNFGDDSRWVTVEVRAKDPTKCGKGNWVLFVQQR